MAVVSVGMRRAAPLVRREAVNVGQKVRIRRLQSGLPWSASSSLTAGKIAFIQSRHSFRNAWAYACEMGYIRMRRVGAAPRGAGGLGATMASAM